MVHVAASGFFTACERDKMEKLLLIFSITYIHFADLFKWKEKSSHNGLFYQLCIYQVEFASLIDIY